MKTFCCSWFCLFWVWLAGVPGVSAGSAGDDFSNNLFSDLAPLLALFGERVATQFLSHSTHWLDNVIFACAPLGLLTAITAAIRVGGSRRLKALIGRAKESVAEAEFELTSSTSTDVCELWYEEGIVRVVGSPTVLELVHELDSGTGGKLSPVSGSGSNSNGNTTVGIYDRTEVMVPKHIKQFGDTHKDAPDEEDLLDMRHHAPNIALNTIGGSHKERELYIVATIGLLLQFGVLTFDAFTVYHPYLRTNWKKDDEAEGEEAYVQRYAYPLTLIGTLGIVIGMYICAHICETATIETKWTPTKPSKNYQIMWIQRAQTVGDQGFRSYAIYAASNRNEILTSHLRPKNVLEVITAFGAGLSISSFVLQFIGLRAMHFSATIAQLIATVIMTLLRVWVRRNLSAPAKPVSVHGTLDPKPDQYTVQELEDGKELELVAKQLTQHRTWSVMTSSDPRKIFTPSSHVHSAQEVVNCRSRLLKLATEQPQAEWKTQSRAYADKLSVVIGEFMDFVTSPGNNLQCRKSIQDISEWSWKIPIATSSVENNTTAEHVECIDISVTRVKQNDRWRPWTCDVDRLDSILSLWMLNSVDSKKPQGHILWLLCPPDDPMQEIIANCWVHRNGNSRIIQDGTLSEWCHDHQMVIDGHLDFRRIMQYPSDCSTTPALDINANYSKAVLSTYASEGELYGQHMHFIFSTFLNNLFIHVEEITPDTTYTVSNTLNNECIRSMVDIVRQGAFATTEEAYRITVCALHAVKLLQYPLILSSTQYILDQPSTESPEIAARHILQISKFEIHRLIVENEQWLLAGKQLCNVIDTFHLRFGMDCELAQEFKEWRRRLAHSLFASGAPPNLTQTTSPPLNLHAALTTAVSDGSIVTCIELLEHTALVDKSDCTAHEIASRNGRLDFLQLFALYNYWDDTKFSAFIAGVHTRHDNIMKFASQQSEDINIQDYSDYNRTQLHKAVSKDDVEMVKILLKQGARIDITDYMLHTPLHIAIQCRLPHMVELLLEHGATMRFTGQSSALEFAARIGNIDIVQVLLDHDAPVAEYADEGAVIGAIDCGHAAVLELLIRQGASVDINPAVAGMNLSPLEVAARAGRTDVMQVLLNHGADINSVKKHRDPPLLVAAESPDRIEVAKLLLNHGADIDARDSHDANAVCVAISNDNEPLLVELLSRGASPNTTHREDRYTALICAVTEGKINYIRILLEAGADVNGLDRGGSSALHYAISRKHWDIAQLLIDQGCDVNIKNNFGESPLNVSLQLGDTFMIELLRGKGALE